MATRRRKKEAILLRDPALPNTTAPDDSAGAFYYIPHGWIGQIRGLVQLLLRRSSWADMTDDEWDALRARINLLMVDNFGSDEVINGVRVNGTALEVLQGGVWTPVGDLCADCDDSGFPPLGNQYSVSGKDRWCYAAWELAGVAQDKCGDFMQQFDAAFTFITENAENIIELATDAISAGFAGIVVEPVMNFLTNATTQPAIDWIRQEVNDTEVLSKVAEKIYCSIKEWDDDGQIGNLEDIMLNEVQASVRASVSQFGVGAFQVDNWGNIVDFVFNGGTNDLLADFVLSYFLAHKAVLVSIGIGDPIPDLVRGYMGKAAFLDDRQCSTFACADDGCLTWDFTAMASLPANFQIDKGTFVPFTGIKFIHEFVSGNNNWSGRMNLRWNLDGSEPLVVNEVRYYLTHNELSILGSGVTSFRSGEPFTLHVQQDQEAIPASDPDAVIMTVGATTLVDYFGTTYLTAGRSTGQAIIDANYHLTKIAICAPASTLAYLDARFDGSS